MSKRLLAVGACLFALTATWFAATNSVGDDAKPADAGWVYEMRTYTADDGKFEALHSRFRDHTMRLFEKHGMKNIGYWTPVDQPNTLVYIVAHKDRDTAKKSWAAFIADPEWQKVYAESHKNGKLVTKVDSVFMTATDYSPIK
jgi:hypothetical protein